MSETKKTSPPSAPTPVKSQTLSNPYFKDADLSAKLVCPITPSDYNFVKCIRPSHGTFTSVVGTLWKKLVNELYARNITEISKVNEFEQFVAGCHLISHDEYVRYIPAGLPRGNGGLPHRPVDGTVSETTASDDRGREEKSRADAASAPAERTDVQSGTGEKGRGGRKGAKGKGTEQKSHSE